MTALASPAAALWGAWDTAGGESGGMTSSPRGMPAGMGMFDAELTFADLSDGPMGAVDPLIDGHVDHDMGLLLDAPGGSGLSGFGGVVMEGGLLSLH